MSRYDNLMAGLTEIETRTNSLLAQNEELLARLKDFKYLLEQAKTKHENFEISTKEFEFLVAEVESIRVIAKTSIEGYNRKLTLTGKRG